MGWSGRAPPSQHEKLARGAQDKEHAMSQKLNAAIAVIGIDIGKNSFHIVRHDHARRTGASGSLVARRRPAGECRYLRDLPAADAALPPRQDAADYAPLVRYPAARVAGRDIGANRRHV